MSALASWRYKAKRSHKNIRINKYTVVHHACLHPIMLETRQRLPKKEAGM
jgi:hypothetical protein